MIRMCQTHCEDVTISNKFEKTCPLKALLYQAMLFEKIVMQFCSSIGRQVEREDVQCNM